jgi:hypothetical protein
VEINGVKYKNLLDHDVKIKGDEVHFFKKSTQQKPKVNYSSEVVPGKGIVGRKKKIVSIQFLPKTKKDVVFIVNSFILEAISEKHPELVPYFAAPGKQTRGADGKVLYADGLYKLG